MSEIKHTPGPWTVNRHGAIVGGEFHQYTNGSAQSQLAMAVGGNGISDEERKANGVLIAAAPELLAIALQYASECGECAGTGRNDCGHEECQDCAFIRAAIAKATESAP